MGNATRIIASLALYVGGCFPPPNPKSDTGPDSHDVDAIEESETPSDSNPVEFDIASNEADDGLEREVDATAECEHDEECAALDVPPCVVGSCIDHRCARQFLAVACDDLDPCTTDDRCDQGTCHGRAFTVAEAANSALVLTATGDPAAVWPTDVVAFTTGALGIVGTYRGILDSPGSYHLESGDAQGLFYGQVAAAGTYLRNLDLTDAGAPLENSTQITPHRIELAEFDALVIASVSRPDVPAATAITRLSAAGTPRWGSGPWIPGTVFRAFAMDANETIVFATFAGEITFKMKTGTSRTFVARGESDFYVARLNDDREALWVNVVSSDGKDNEGSLVVPMSDAFFWAVTLAGGDPRLNDTPLGSASGAVTTLQVTPNGVVTRDERAWPSTLGSPAAGTVASDGSIVASSMLGVLPSESVRFQVQRFVPGAEATWTHPFDTDNGFAGAVFGGPGLVPLGRDFDLVLWVIVDGFTVTGWPATHSGAKFSTLFGVVSPSGVLVSAWTLPGFFANALDFKATPREVITGNTSAAPTPDGGLAVATESLGVSLGPDFGGQTTAPGQGVILKYSPAHVWGCAVAP